ncbi:MAG: 50S ribosomal protein L13 [uncultured bacterium]|nr:MAG: 50S ribosomal protein L13 [uncultured bacterium]
MKKTFAPNPEKVIKKWHFINAEGEILGKVAVNVAKKLMGKEKAVFTPNEELGDKVVVTNVEKIAVTGNKDEKKVYHHYTGFPGGLRTETLGHMRKRKPTEILRLAVTNMLPRNKLRKLRMANLYIYAGAEHPHKAQETKK